MGSNQYWAGRVYDLYVYFMTGTLEGSTESGFMEKLGTQPATPGFVHQGGLMARIPLVRLPWLILTLRKLFT